MEDFELEIKREFINEALMNLEECEGAFMELESSSDPKPLLEKIFRMAHNLKGGSRAVGFADVAEFTHQLENLVLKIQQGGVALTPPTVTTLLHANDRLVEMLATTKSDLTATFDNSDLLAEIKSCMEGTGSSNAPVEAQTPAPPAPEPLEAAASVVETIAAEPVSENPTVVEATAPVSIGGESEPLNIPSASDFFPEEKTEVAAVPAQAAEALATPPTQTVFEPKATAPAVTPKAELPKSEAPKTQPANKPVAAKENEDEIVRVSLSRIDMLNNFVGELIVVQSVIQQDQSAFSSKVSSSIQQLSKIAKEIQGISMSLRMLPVKPLIQKLQRVVRDTALALKKEVQFDVQGENSSIDKSVLDRLADPLIHILRNAVDHGLESTEDRVKNSKNPKGHVELSFMNEGNHLIVEIRDDGKGINPEIIRKKAIEKRIISEGQSLSEKQLIHLIFHAGFSTKSETSEISGRGVGMDVVKTNIEKIGGAVDISTEVGKGSVFRLKIPLSLAVIDGWVVRTEKNRYVIPVSQVVETVSLKSHKIFNVQGIGACIELRGTIVPLFELENTLMSKSGGVQPDQIALVVNVDSRLVGLAVSDVLRSQQIVVKPIKFGIKAQKGWIGSCVLGDGMATLIVSPADLLEGKIVTNELSGSEGRAA